MRKNNPPPASARFALFFFFFASFFLLPTLMYVIVKLYAVVSIHRYHNLGLGKVGYYSRLRSPIFNYITFYIAAGLEIVVRKFSIEIWILCVYNMEIIKSFCRLMMMTTMILSHRNLKINKSKFVEKKLCLIIYNQFTRKYYTPYEWTTTIRKWKNMLQW